MLFCLKSFDGFFSVTLTDNLVVSVFYCSFLSHCWTSSCNILQQNFHYIIDTIKFTAYIQILNQHLYALQFEHCSSV